MATTKKPAAKKPAAKKAADFTVRITTAGMKYEAKGQTVAEAILALPIKAPPRVRVIMVVTRGDYKRELVLPPYAVARVFSPSRVTQQVALKNLSLLFGL